jgi:AraC-like DNA-binding protein
MLPVDARGKTSEQALRALLRRHMPEPRWLLRSPTEAQVELEIDADLEWFEGHFPHAAVLPGVALLDWALQLGCSAFGVAGRCRRMGGLKFQRIVQPGAVLSLHLEWQPERSALGFRYSSGDVPHASGRLLLETEAAASA